MAPNLPFVKPPIPPYIMWPPPWKNWRKKDFYSLVTSDTVHCHSLANHPLTNSSPLPNPSNFFTYWYWSLSHVTPKRLCHLDFPHNWPLPHQSQARINCQMLAQRPKTPPKHSLQQVIQCDNQNKNEMSDSPMATLISLPSSASGRKHS